MFLKIKGSRRKSPAAFLKTTRFSELKFNHPLLSFYHGKNQRVLTIFKDGEEKNIPLSENNIEINIIINYPVTYKSVDVMDKNTTQFKFYCIE